MPDNKLKHPFAIMLVFTATVCVLLDFTASRLFLPKTARVASRHYHHDLKKNASIEEAWGPLHYTLTTNSLGFKDTTVRRIELSSSKHRILFLGDSFTEGVGYPYEETFVGIFDKGLDHKHYEVLNAAVNSYSPKLYFLKLNYLLESLHLKIDELFVFIDNSDIPDELTYRGYSDGSWSPAIKGFLKNNSFLCNRLKGIANMMISGARSRMPAGINDRLEGFGEGFRHPRFGWAIDERAYETWGKPGLLPADTYMGRIVQLCMRHGITMHIAVYPWPSDITHNNTHSIQITHWKEFAGRNGIGFLDYFPYFLNGSPADSVLKDYYIDGDIHWNANGHRYVAQILSRYRQHDEKKSVNP